MGAGTLMGAVTNAGPLLHLYEIGQFSLFHVFEPVVIVNAVWNETVGKQRIPEDAISIIPFQIETPTDTILLEEFIQKQKVGSLHPGEIECLYYCHTKQVQLFLTDDLAAREAAKRLNIIPVGSVGIVLRAYRENQLSKPSTIETLRDLQRKSSLFVTSTIIEQAIEMI